MLKAIKLHRRLRYRQEFLCDFFVTKSQQRHLLKDFVEDLKKNESLLYEFQSVNNAVRKVEKKLPWIYFIICDIFGFNKFNKK